MRCLSFIALLFVFASCGDASFSESRNRSVGESEIEPRVTSPDGALKVLFERSDPGEISYFLLKDGEELISRSGLGFSESELGRITKDLTIERIKTTSGVEAYDLPWGEVASVNAPYAEVQLSLKHVPTEFTFSVDARLFDDGLGIRYRFPKQVVDDVESGGRTLQIIDEHTEFNFPCDPLVNWGFTSSPHSLPPPHIREAAPVYQPSCAISYSRIQRPTRTQSRSRGIPLV